MLSWRRLQFPTNKRGAMGVCMIRLEPVPRHYQMAWNATTHSIEVWLRTELLPELQRASKSRMIDYYRQKLKLGQATGSDQAFGFEECPMTRIQGNKELLGFAYQLPPRLSRPRTLHGSRYDFRRMTVGSINLSLMMDILHYGETKVDSKKQQVMIAHLVADPERSLHGYSLSVEFSKDASLWIQRHAHEHMEHVSQSMCQAYTRVFGKGEKLYNFRAFGSVNKPFHLSVPGDCSCLGVDGMDHDDPQNGMGFQYNGHNIDSPGQQLSLLAGMATMSEIITAALDKGSRD
jgi:hypothetical protein